MSYVYLYNKEVSSKLSSNSAVSDLRAETIAFWSFSCLNSPNSDWEMLGLETTLKKYSEMHFC